MAVKNVRCSLLAPTSAYFRLVPVTRPSIRRQSSFHERDAPAGNIVHRCSDPQIFLGDQIPKNLAVSLKTWAASVAFVVATCCTKSVFFEVCSPGRSG